VQAPNAGEFRREHLTDFTTCRFLPCALSRGPRGELGFEDGRGIAMATDLRQLSIIARAVTMRKS
jgi:hypothetical protein